MNSATGKPSMRLWAMLSFAVVLGAILFVPARIGSMGYFPPDDANRHVGKAIAGKPWNQILVMRKDVTTDMHHGWDALLTCLHQRFGIGKYGLMVFSVSFCFILFTALPVFFLRRPEAWLIVYIFYSMFDPGSLFRFFLGRPFIIGCAALSFVLLTWRKFAGQKTPLGWMCVLTGVMACMAWIAPTAAYLFAIPFIGFTLAREWRALVRLALCAAAGSCIGYALTGYPIALVKDVSYMLFAGPDQKILSRMLVTEFQPSVGNFLVLFAFIALIVWHVLRRKWNRQIIDNPLFFNAVVGMFLGILVVRFWIDWGAIAAMLWLAVNIEVILTDYFTYDSLRRFALCAAVAVGFYAVMTADVGSRWTFMSPRFECSYEKAKPEEKQWFPDSGGIVYNDRMDAFYRMFFDNPTAPWRYVLGFEPVLMLPEDLATYRSIQRMGGTVDLYQPWIDKMRPCDRMLILTNGKIKPFIDKLEWHYVSRDTWFGRLPPRADTSAASGKSPVSRCGEKSAS